MNAHTQEEFSTAEQIEALREDLRQLMAREGLTQADIARGADIPYGTFTPWMAAKYKGDNAGIAGKVRRWILAREEGRKIGVGLPAEPGFVETTTAREVLNALQWAAQMPGIAVITLGPGMSKTSAAKEFERRTPHAYRVVMRPSTGSVHSMVHEIAQRLQVSERNPSRIVRAIGEKVQRNGRHPLIIMDEAQNLKDAAVDELRHLLDEFGCGIALLGNEDVSTRWGRATPKDGYGQLHRRIGLRIRRLKPLAEDVDAFLSAWRIEDEAMLKFLRMIGGKPGALGQIAETIKFGSLLAAGERRALTVDDLKGAWANRSEEAR